MKHSLLFTTVLLLTSLASMGVQAAEKIRVSVPQFTNRSASGNPHEDGNCYGWYWFRSDLGEAFQERLIASLLKDARYEVLERETLTQIVDNEINLKNGERSSKIRKGLFRRAQYTLVGAVSAFEYCESGSSGGINLGSLIGIGDLDLSAKTKSALVEVEIRAVDTTTGRVVTSATGKGNESSASLDTHGLIRGVNFKGKQFKTSVLGHAIDRAVSQAASEVMAKLAK